MQGLNTDPWTTSFDSILNHQFTQKLKLVVDDKFNYISLTTLQLNKTENFE